MTWIDSLIVAVYLFGIVAIGIAGRGKQDDVQDYFTAKRGFKGTFGLMMVGLSIGATLFSGLSFVAYPSVVYTYGITALTSLVGFPVAYIVLRFWFFPRYLAVPQSSPYEIIERRMGKPTRLVASAMFVLLRMCWMSALIYAPVLVIMAAAGLGKSWFWPLVLMVGLSSTIYTVAGGIRGVIVADAVQFVIIIAVLASTIGYVLIKMPLSLGEVSAYLTTDTGLLTLNWSLDPTLTMTVWAMAIGGTMQNMSSFTADQMSLQRYLAAGDVKSASSAFGTSMVSTLLVLLLLALVGLTLGAWYSVHPDAAVPRDADKVFPYFVATQLPVGFMGMIIAAILAATMDSVASGVNALSGSLLCDFVPLSTRVSPQRLLYYARVVSAAIGVAATIGAGFVENLGSIFNIMNVFFGVFLGPLLGCMFCTVSSLQVRGSVLIGGMLAGCLAGVGIAYSPIATLWVTLVSSLVTVSIAWGGSKIIGARRSS